MEKKQEFTPQEKGLLKYDPVVILRDVAKRWLLIVILALIVAMLTYIITDQFFAPSYRTGTTLVVTSRDSSATVYTNLNATTALANVFTELVSSSVFRQTILEDTGLSYFSGKITAAVVPDSNILNMYVTDRNPRTAFLVTQAILENHHEVTDRVLGDVALEVLQKPTVPVTPYNWQSPVKLMVLAMLVTAVGSCGLLGFMSYARDTVRSGKEAREKLSCKHLGSIPHEKKYHSLRAKIRRPKASILVTDPLVSFRFVEAVRKACRRIEQQMSGEKSLMVVSLLENEGKSTVAVNLSLVLAKRHDRVLLIDCDLRKPACAKQLGVNWGGRGVKDVLAGKAAPEEVIVRDGRSGLHLLLEKAPVRNCEELIGSARMGSLIRWAKEHYDFVVLDLPPMGLVADAESIMEHVDASVLVVCQNAAVAPALNHCVENLQKGKAKLLGCVLNNVYGSFLSAGRGYGSGYGKYGYYGKYGRYGHYGKYGHYGAYGPGDTGRRG